MGVERAVTRWHIQQQQILNQITALETKLAQDKQTPQKDLVQQLNDAHKKLRALGPCPKPMMG
jgi:hypothetical protein